MRTLQATVCLVLAMLGLAGAASAAHAVWGENAGLIPINGGGGSGTLDVPALPGAGHYFYAGTCDAVGAPAAGTDLAPLGGIGAMPSTTPAPFSAGATIVDVPLLGRVPNCIDWRIGRTPGGAAGTTAQNIFTPPPNWRLPADVQAGGHPDGTVALAVVPDGDIDNIYVDLPAGFVGDPTAVDRCTAEQFAVKPQLCPPSSQVGVLNLSIKGAPIGGSNFGAGHSVGTLPVFNLEPREGNLAELGLVAVTIDGAITVRLVAKARTNSDFGVTTFIGQIPAAALPLSQQTITVWGVPWAAHNDVYRAPQGIGWSSPCSAQPPVGTLHVIPPGGLSPECRTSYDPSWGPIRPFLTNLTECSGQALSTSLAMDVYTFPGSFTAEGDPDLGDPDWKRYQTPAPAMTGCEKVQFAPSASFGATSGAADAPSGLDVDIDIPANDDPSATVDASNAAAHWRSDAGLATSQLDKTVVTLPDGIAVNPSAATGLQACSDDEIGVRAQGNPPLFNNGDPFDSDASDGAECPQASIIGTVQVTTPVLDDPLEGELVLGSPKSTDPTSGEMLRMFLVVRLPERGLIAKVYGSATADPATGRITATFDNNPRVPVENVKVRVKGGERGMLATPQSCGTKTTTSVFGPWSAAHGAGGVAKAVDSSFAITSRCASAFAPALAAGMDNRAARGGGTFSFRFSRQDGEPWLAGLTATLPKGLLASVRGLPLCTNAQADAGGCPSSSQIGIVDAKAGSGDPFVLEEKGQVYLTEGYKGGAYGLAVKIRPIAGPFRGAMELSPIIVRQAIHVDRRTAQVTAVSDPLPLIHHGVPLRVREVTVKIDRDNFMLNPSGCSPKQVQAALSSPEGARADVANHFRATNCASLPFKPRLKLALTGRRQVRTGKHPGVRARVTQKGVGEAGIEKAVVTLPKSLALDVNNAQALCEFVDGTRPDLENHCPKGSIVGRARAKTPLLNHDLAGNVYFVKNVRIDKKTGNQIRTLPMIVVALRGEIAINLWGKSSTTRAGKLVNTFASVPDAPVSRFNLNIKGGKNGILAVTRTRRARINLCSRPKSHVALADMDGHNGKRYDRKIRMKTPCKKRKRGGKGSS